MKYLREPIEDEEARPVNLDDKKLAQLHQKAMGIIRLWIDQTIYHHVVKKSKASVLQRKLEILYKQSTIQNKANLMKGLVKLEHSITKHISEFQGLVDQLTTLKIILDYELQALLLLSSLLDSWETLVV